MTKCIRVAVFFLAILPVAAAHAGPAAQERRPLLSHVAEDSVFQLAGSARVASGNGPDVSQGATHLQLKKCQSKKKGMLIGAAIGAVAGAATAVYVIRQVGGILGTSRGAPRYLTYWMIGGAGAGALGGMAYCR